MTPERKKYLAGIGRKEAVIRTYIDNVKQQLKDCKKWLKADNGSYAPRLEMIKYNILITKQILMMLKKQLPQRWPEKKLKPCPFCGCESVIIIDHEDGLGACDYYVACDRCSASGSFSDTLDDAIRKWNNRVINHGTWEQNYMPSPHLECSECGYIVDCSDGSNYCPACGARMDKKE